MTAMRIFLAACIGAVVSQLFVYVAGILAALGTPSGYFKHFGRDHQELALGLWSTASFALPMFALGAVCTVLVFAMLKPLTRSLAVAYVFGLALVWLYWQFSYFLATGTPFSAEAALSMLSAVYASNAWHLPSAYAPWFGVAASLLWLHGRARHARRRTDA